MGLDLNNPTAPKRMLQKVAQVGYAKTSMQHIADLMGVSRQAIYKRFQSKSECYHWAINQYLSNMYLNIFDALSDNSTEPMQTLVNVFELLIIDAVDLVQQQYGKQVFDDALSINKASEQDWSIRLNNRLGEFLHNHGLAPSASAGFSTAFVLIMASKGVLLANESLKLLMVSHLVVVFDNPLF